MSQPRVPTLAATAYFVLFVAILGYPLLTGQWLVGPNSDQIGGFAVRDWAAREWHATGHVPLWDPMIFGGLPYVATLAHGDVFYPLSFLRLLMPADVVLGVWFVLHTILAGLFTYLLLRRLGASWLGSVVGGLAYQLSGIIISLPNPGHDGKVAVSSLLPLAFLALYAAVRERRWWGYGLLSAVVGLSLLSPHVQLTYYLLLASGLFALYCAFGEPDTEPVPRRLGRLAIALGAVGVGFAVAAPQILPFLEYLPHSPRAQAYRDFAGAASYAIPWNHVPEFFIGGFTGEGETYWGSNPLKLHSEYLSLAVIALAVLGIADRGRRRLVKWLGGIALLFLLISLGASTPFYRLWWTVMPYVKQTRAPGMAFFVVAMIVAVYAAFGTDRLERGEAKRWPTIALIVAGVVGLLGLAGGFGGLATALAQDRSYDAADAHAAAIRAGAVLGAVTLAVVALLALFRQRGRLPAAAFMVALPLVVGTDLWINGRPFWHFQPPARQGLYHDDALVERVKQAPLPYRVLDLSALMGANAYPLNVLMGHDIPQVLGYFGFEHRYYDDLLGGQNEWRNLLSTTKLWDLLAVRFVIVPDTLRIPGYQRVLGPVAGATGRPVYLYEAATVPPYARVVPAAAKVDEERIPPTLVDPRLPFDRLVLLTSDAPISPSPFTDLPAPSASRATVSAWSPGAMTIELAPAPTAAGYLLVSENWYPDWQARVDGVSARVLRGDNSLITVPVPAGARRVELTFRSPTYERGWVISFAGLALILASVVVSAAQRRRTPVG